MLNFDLQNHRPLREIVYEELKRQILKGKIVPGARMMEVELADEMGVSRTPVREAIRKLEKEGLVTIEPRKGAYASDISVKDMLDILEVREDLEALASKLAAERMSQEGLVELKKISTAYNDAVMANNTEEIIHYDELFHQTIVANSGNGTLLQVLEMVQGMALRFRYLYYDDFNRYKKMPKEHEEIVHAIESGDGERAKFVADKHVGNLKLFVANEGDSGFKSNF